MNQTLLASIIIVIGASAWGVYWIPVREIEAAGVDSAWAVAVFNFPAFLIALIVPLFLPRLPQGAGRLVMIAGLFAGAGLSLYGIGLVTTSVVRATLLFYLTPVWSTLLAMIFLGEQPGWARWTALAMGLAGLVLTLGASLSDILGGFGVGEAFGLASGIVWAVAAVLVRRLGETVGQSRAIDARLVMHQFIWVILIAVAAAMLMGAPPPAPGDALGAISLLVVVFSLFVLASLYAIFWALGLLSPGRSGLLMMSEVVVAVISAAILLPEEALSAREWLGAALIIGAGAVEVLGGERAPQSKPI